MDAETAIIALVVAGTLLVFCEVFVPGGILGVLGGVLIAVSIVSAYVLKGPVWGSWLLFGSVVFGFAGFYLWITFIPRTPVGKRLILNSDAHDWHAYDPAKAELLGVVGEAHTSLRPSGTAHFDGKKVDVVTQGEMIDAHSEIKVVKVEGNRVVVAAVEEVV
ncbi:MAG: NfeD family protein [Lentisphaeria bacterium]|nr:NfeD family protein [Lentisphaeria bacterium]